jgi:hypothetical protein
VQANGTRATSTSMQMKKKTPGPFRKEKPIYRRSASPKTSANTQRIADDAAVRQSGIVCRRNTRNESHFDRPIRSPISALISHIVLYFDAKEVHLSRTSFLLSAVALCSCLLFNFPAERGSAGGLTTWLDGQHKLKTRTHTQTRLRGMLTAAARHQQQPGDA